MSLSHGFATKFTQQAASRIWFAIVCLLLFVVACQERQRPTINGQPITPQPTLRALVPTFTPTLLPPAAPRQGEVTVAPTMVPPPASTTATPAPPVQPLSPDTLLFARANGDLVLYDLNLGQERLLLMKAQR